jgi:hypothetical protein
MDYPTEEHNDGSPWASSPQPTVTSFQPPDLDHPSSPEQPFSDPRAAHDTPQRQPTEEQQAPASPESASVRQQPKKKDRPLYKLQAKITSLERNGRKDPIIKFDVYVSTQAIRSMIY